VREVDADVVDAARGMGMSAREIVFRIKLPLALPVLFAGVRTARKHIGWYTEGLPGGDSFRDRLNVLTETTAQLHAVRDYFSGLADRHERLPLAPYQPTTLLN